MRKKETSNLTRMWWVSARLTDHVTSLSTTWQRVSRSNRVREITKLNSAGSAFYGTVSPFGGVRPFVRFEPKPPASSSRHIIARIPSYKHP
jgi:hypothetical protein